MTIPFTESEFEALMSRPVCRLLTADDRGAFEGRRVLITGAGGSIGSELTRQVARCRPAQLTLVDQSELNLFQIEREITRAEPGVPLDVVLGDVTRSRMRAICRAARPHVVFHAAAYKHVTMAERAVCAAAETNVLGALQMAEAAREAGARFVLISSDKAASPHSVMGATKRLAEIVVTGSADRNFQPVAVRLGNVLGSSGSVLTVMRQCIRAGQPVPLTDPAATRYFMTAGEAVSLVIKAERLSQRMETYWLDMGQPVAIGELARRLMRIETTFGYAPVPLQVIGLRPGEKLQEESTVQGIRMCRTSHPRIWVARQTIGDVEATAVAVRRLRNRAARGDAVGTLNALAAAVPDYRVSPEAIQAARPRQIAPVEHHARRA